MISRLRTGATPLAILLLSGCLPSALVERVIDGDTVVIAGGKSVRLLGLDAPALDEPGGAEASARLRELVVGRTVRIRHAAPLTGRVDDMYGRLLARILVAGRDVGRILLSEGLARPRPDRP